MTLLFGTLTQDFVNFGIIVEQAKAGDAQAQARVSGAAAQFRSVAAKDASYLVCIGELIYIAI